MARLLYEIDRPEGAEGPKRIRIYEGARRESLIFGYFSEQDVERQFMLCPEYFGRLMSALQLIHGDLAANILCPREDGAESYRKAFCALAAGVH